MAGNRFFRIFGKTGPTIRIFFSLKPPRDQDEANKKKFCQIGPAVPELLRNKQTDRHTYRQTKTLITLYMDSGFPAIIYFDHKWQDENLNQIIPSMFIVYELY